MGLAVRRGLKLDNCLVRGTEIDTPGAQSHLQSGVVTVLDQEVIRLVHPTAGTTHEFVSLCGYLTIDDMGASSTTWSREERWFSIVVIGERFPTTEVPHQS